MNLTGVSAGLNFAAQRVALRWAKEHLPKEEYNGIKKSYNSMLKWTIIFIVCCIPVMIAFLSPVVNVPFSKGQKRLILRMEQLDM